LINGESGYVQGKKTSPEHLVSRLFFGTITLHSGSFKSHQQSNTANTLCFTSLPLLLFKNKVSKSEGTSKVEQGYGALGSAVCSNWLLTRTK